MARIQYEDWRPGAKALAIVDEANEICAEFRAQGFQLTLRQLYYQFISRDVFPNTERSYKNLGTIVNRARMAGLMDWRYIEDRGRNLAGSQTGSWDPRSVVESVKRMASIARWDRQPHYVEVWVEKDALSGVVSSATSAVQVPHMACRGYMSQSEQHAAGQRFLRKIENGKRVTVFHLGDHDPSGIDMTRDIIDRLTRFVDVGYTGIGLFDEGSLQVAHDEVADAFDGTHPLQIERIALNIDQVRFYNPPPNPAKLTDSRAEGYIREHGHSSWELDAMPPSALVDLINAHVRPLIDLDIWNEDADIEHGWRTELAGLSDHWDEVREFLADNNYISDDVEEPDTLD